MNARTMTAREIQKKVDSYYWHHSIDFGNGVISKGSGSLEYIKSQGNALYDGVNLTDRSLLDIGAWNGAFSFEAKHRGAGRVLASDHYCWNREQFKGRETFDLGLRLTGLEIEARDIDVPEITPASIGTFDAVLFSGVFYHLLTPVHLTRQISECASHVLILETHQDFLESDKPGMVFYPGVTLNGDGSNWWGPNPHVMYEMLKEFGFARVFYQDSPGYDDPSKDNFRKRGIYHAFRTEESFRLMAVGNANWIDLESKSARADVFRPLHPDLTMRISELEAELAKLRASTSWKITAPLRAVTGSLRK